jgi:hypothetical protein
MTDNKNTKLIIIFFVILSIILSVSYLFYKKTKDEEMLIDNNTNLVGSSVITLFIIAIISIILFTEVSKKGSMVFAVISLIAVTGFFFFLSFYQYKPANKIRKKNGVIIPFSARLKPDWDSSASSENGVPIVKYTDNNKELPLPAISCPEGYGIDIISAYLEVDDPYSQCSVNPDPLLQVTCGYIPTDYKDQGKCETDKDCSVGTKCNIKDPDPSSSRNRCIPKTCTASLECTGGDKGMKPCNSNIGTLCKGKIAGSKGEGAYKGLVCANMVDSDGNSLVLYVADPEAGPCMACIDNSTGLAADATATPPTSGVCVLMPDCMNVNNNSDTDGRKLDGLNNTCSAKGFHQDAFKCRSRDASAYLANFCNGEHSCLGGSAEKDSKKWLPNMQDGAFGPLPCLLEPGTDDYKTLPVNIGKTSDVEGGSSYYNQGYKVHGLYSCILKETEDE